MLVELPTFARPLGPAVIDAPLLRLPISGLTARTGFPSPADDFLDDSLDLNDLILRNAPATFLYRAEGLSMLMAGICDGDFLAVDRSVTPEDGDVVIACYDGNQPTCKVLKICSDHIELHSRNPHFSHIVLPPETEVDVFAVVGVIRSMHRKNKRVRPR